MQLLTTKQVMDKLSFSRTTLAKHIKLSGFPAPIKFGVPGEPLARAAAVRWEVQKVDQWIRDYLHTGGVKSPKAVPALAPGMSRLCATRLLSVVDSGVWTLSSKGFGLLEGHSVEEVTVEIAEHLTSCHGGDPVDVANRIRHSILPSFEAYCKAHNVQMPAHLLKEVKRRSTPP